MITHPKVSFLTVGRLRSPGNSSPWPPVHLPAAGKGKEEVESFSGVNAVGQDPKHLQRATAGLEELG